MHFRFPSLAFGHEIGYLLEPRHGYRTGRPLAYWAQLFMTYGDGLTMHSPPTPVPDDRLVDFCASLAAFLLTPHDEADQEKLFSGLRIYWPEPTPRELLEFVYRIRYEEGKPRRYYSLDEMKISASEAKRHDKRYEPIPDWADGSVKAMATLLHRSHYLLLDSYRLYADCYEFHSRQKNASWSDRPSKLLEVEDADGPFDAVSEIIAAWRGLERASRMVKSYLSNVQNAKQIKAAEAEGPGSGDLVV